MTSVLVTVAPKLGALIYVASEPWQMLQSVDIFCFCVGASMPLWALCRSLESCKLVEKLVKRKLFFAAWLSRFLFVCCSVACGIKPENGRIPEKHALSTGASREAPVDNARLTLDT